MNGFHILYFMLGFFASIYILWKIRILKEEARFWKENCFIAAERYNDLLVKKSMGIALDKAFKRDSLKVN